jgi:hypothetical protein
MKQHRLHLLLGLLGLVVSATLLLAIVFTEMRNRETLTTRINTTQEAHAAQPKISPPSLQVHPKTADEIIATIDKNFNNEIDGRNFKE